MSRLTFLTCYQKQKFTDVQLITLRKLFNELDVDGSGAIDQNELKNFLVKLGNPVTNKDYNILKAIKIK
jgi:Ca2+-binding EF-hand superfamily protein